MNSVPKTQPLVSIVIPAYNHENFIEESIESSLNQTYTNIELIIVDDSSPDSTHEKAVSLTSKLDGETPPRHKIVRNKNNLGICKTLNRGLSLASGDYIFILFSDNFLHSECIAIAEQSVQFQGLLICDFYRVDFNGVIIGTYEPEFLGDGILNKAKLLKAIFSVSGDEFMTAPYLMSRESLNKMGGFDENFGCEDFDFYIRWAVGPGMLRVPEKLYFYRMLPNSLGARPNKYADGLVPAIQKYQDALGNEYPSFYLDTQLRTIKAYLGNHFYIQAFSKACGYLRSSKDLSSSIRIIAFSLSYSAKTVVKTVLPYAILRFFRRVTWGR
ncbi:glycosyltransferase [Paracoccaceae bacterium]|nr:glycosyltransferase [Paracoccaceae bacterium]